MKTNAINMQKNHILIFNNVRYIINLKFHNMQWSESLIIMNFLVEMNAAYDNILNFTAVKWLSRGCVLEGFLCSIRKYTIFKNTFLCLKVIIEYPNWLFLYLNELNIKLHLLNLFLICGLI